MTNLTSTDFDALTRAIAAARSESPARSRQIDRMLRERPWEKVAIFCAYSAQINSMALLPHEHTVVYADSPESHALRRRVIAAGLSRFEPFPLQALDRVEQQP